MFYISLHYTEVNVIRKNILKILKTSPNNDAREIKFSNFLSAYLKLLLKNFENFTGSDYSFKSYKLQ